MEDEKRGSAAIDILRVANGDKNSHHSRSWKKAYLHSKHVPDPWKHLHIDEEFPDEVAIRHRYNARKKTWVKDEVHVRMENEPFDKGAMRLCYRTKKLSNFTKSRNWKHAGNHVAKRYINDVPREMYFNDVILQMDAKLWGEEFNRHFPPKKVDILQISILEMKDRPGSPLFHVEHYIEGKYIKYNSNSGYIHLDDTLRATPQAFSHFTFERSNHTVMVVDIQGVGDLYTDPQLHSINLDEYGEANLGGKGMALFFNSHRCNKICESMGLSPFDLSEPAMERIEKQAQLLTNSMTLTKDMSCLSVSSSNRDDIIQIGSPLSSPTSPASPPLSARSLDSNSSLEFTDSSSSELSSPALGYSSAEECEKNGYFFGVFSHRSSSVVAESQTMAKVTEKLRQATSVLGEIHFYLSVMNGEGRFTEKEPDLESAKFHLQHSVDCLYPKAVKTQAQIYLQLSHEALPCLSVEDTEENKETGFQYMELASGDGDLEAMMFIAHAYDTGNGLPGSDRSPSWSIAVPLYEKIAQSIENMGEDAQMQVTTDPLYKLYARLADMYREGGHGIEKDPQKSGDLYTSAAEQAMNDMKGKLANKYYMLAEEAWGEIKE